MSGYSHSRIEVAGLVPNAVDLKQAEIVINEADGLLFTKDKNGLVIPVGGSGSGEGGLITQNQNTLTEDFALADGFSGVVTSGFTIAEGVTLTIPVGSVLSVV